MPTVSIRETLSRMPGGHRLAARTWSQVSDYLWNHYINSQAEKDRLKRFAERQRLYLGCGESDMEQMIELVFKTKEVKALRKEWLSFAQYNLVLRRVIQEQATVYTLPAERRVGPVPESPDPADTAAVAAFDAIVEHTNEQNRRYQEVLRLCRFHEVMQQFNARLLLHRAVAIVPRMRELPNGEWVPTIDLVIPAKFHAVRDPVDPTLCIALIFETDCQLADDAAAAPKWHAMTWHEYLWINSNGRVLEDVVQEHGMGRLPAILATIDPPDGQLIDDTTGQDLVAAQKSVTFLQVLMLKEAKSATKQTLIQGDLSRAERNQPDDSEIPQTLPEGVSAQVVDRGMAFLDFDRAATRVGDTAAANHGVAAEVTHHGSIASADARELVRVPLRERRLQQHVPLREIERELAKLLAVIVAQRRPDLAFSTDGWSMDFADPQTPLGTKESLEVLDHELRLGLTSELRALMDRNPDLTFDQAKAALMQFVEDRVFRMQSLKEFTSISGGLPQIANEMFGGSNTSAQQQDAAGSRTEGPTP
jgi:hypothetical protein